MSSPQSQLKVIADELANARSRKSAASGADLFGHKFKDDLEWLILGTACELMISAETAVPVFAEKSETPDFKLYSKDGKYTGGIEIAEAMQPNYRRHAIFKDKNRDRTPKPVYSIENPWFTLREILKKKSLKPYPADTALLVYFDIWLFSFKDVSTPALKQLINEHLRQPFEGCTKFTEVLIIDAGMKDLIRLSPRVEILVVN